MNRLIMLVVGVVVAGTIAGLPVVGAVQNTPEDSALQAIQHSNTSTGNVTPGEQLSGVVGVQAAEFEGDLERRSFGIKIAKAATNDSKARAIKAQLDSTQDRLNELKEQKARLEEARENGSISEGRFKAEMAQLAARTETVKQLSNDTEAHAEGLPRDVLEQNGVNVDAIQQLKQEAKNLSGPEVAAIAQTIAGRQVRGTGPGQAPSSVGPPGDSGPPSNVGPQRGGQEEDEDTTTSEADQAIERAESRVQAARERVQEARNRVSETNGSADAVSALERAEEQLNLAEAALDAARTARKEGNLADAVTEASQAESHAADARTAATEAIQNADSKRNSGSDGPDEDPGSGQNQGSNGSDNARDGTNRGQ